MRKILNVNREKAFELFKQNQGNITNRAIANLLNEDEKKIAVWKQRDKWISKTNVIQQENKCCTTEEISTPNIRNRGAPKNSKNNYKHGIYEKLQFELLTPEEQELYMDLEFDKIEEYKKIIRFCDLQILKFMKLIKELEKKSGLTLNSISERKKTFKFENFTEEETINTTIAPYEIMLKYNNEIEKAKAKKMRCLEMLIKLENDNERLLIEKEKLKIRNNSGLNNTQDISIEVNIGEDFF